MSDDVVGSVALWCLTVLAAAVVLPVIVAGGATVVVGRSLVRVLRGQALAERGRVRRELARISHERDSAIRDIVHLRHQAEREMRARTREGRRWR